MHRIDEDGHVGNQFVEGDPSSGQQPTRVGAPWLNAVQEEIAQAIEATGGVLDKGNNGQLAAIIAALDTLRAFLVDRVYETTGERLGVKGLDSSGSVVGQQVLAIAPNDSNPGVIGRGFGAADPSIDLNALGAGVVGAGAEGNPGVAGKGGTGGGGAPGVVGVGTSGKPGVSGESATGSGVDGYGQTGVTGFAEGSGLGAGVRAEGEGQKMGLWATTRGSAAAVHAESEGGTGAPVHIVPQATAPSAAGDGSIYYDSGTNKFRGRANGAWVDLH